MSLRYAQNVCAIVSLLAMMGGCEQKLDVPPAPVAPSAAQWARDFQEPRGALTQERQSDLIEWALGSGGAGALVGLIVGDLLLTQWLAPLTGQSSSSERPEQESSTSPLIEGLRVEGWAQLELPCTSGAVRLNLILAQSGISPVVWGELSACSYPDLDLFMDMSITVFAPGLYAPVFSAEGWSADEPQGVWLWIQGEIEYQGTEVDIDAALEISTTGGRTAILYEAEDDRFIITLDETLSADALNGDLEELLNTLTFGLETGDAAWSCAVESGTCMETSP